MSRFNFTNITLQSRANIEDVMNNFTKIENLGITESEVNSKIDEVNNDLNTINTNLSRVVTSSNNGLMSSTDKNKLDGISEGATATTIIDNLTSDSSTAALSAKQGKALSASLSQKQKNISRGTTTPSGGSNGDMYIQYFN